MDINVVKSWLPTRVRKKPITTIVLHASAGASASSSISWLKKIGLSYHYIIERDGQITKLAPTSRVAFHAGKSVGPQGASVNDYSIGICFANRNNGEPYTKEQIKAALELVTALRGEGIKWITTHYLISPGRKNDPYKFDFKSFATWCGVTPWRPNSATPWNIGV